MLGFLTTNHNNEVMSWIDDIYEDHRTIDEILDDEWFHKAIQTGEIDDEICCDESQKIEETTSQEKRKALDGSANIRLDVFFAICDCIRNAHIPFDTDDFSVSNVKEDFPV